MTEVSRNELIDLIKTEEGELRSKVETAKVEILETVPNSKDFKSDSIVLYEVHEPTLNVKAAIFNLLKPVTLLSFDLEFLWTQEIF